MHTYISDFLELPNMCCLLCWLSEFVFRWSEFMRIQEDKQYHLRSSKINGNQRVSLLFPASFINRNRSENTENNQKQHWRTSEKPKHQKTQTSKTLWQMQKRNTFLMYSMCSWLTVECPWLTVDHFRAFGFAHSPLTPVPSRYSYRQSGTTLQITRREHIVDREPR